MQIKSSRLPMAAEIPWRKELSRAPFRAASLVRKNRLTAIARRRAISTAVPTGKVLAPLAFQRGSARLRFALTLDGGCNPIPWMLWDDESRRLQQCAKTTRSGASEDAIHCPHDTNNEYVSTARDPCKERGEPDSKSSRHPTVAGGDMIKEALGPLPEGF